MYRPPGARGAPSTFKLHDDEDDKKTTGGSSSVNASGGGPKKEEPLSKTALKNKKKREAAKKRKEEDEEVVGGGDPDAGGHQGHHVVGGNNGYQGAAGLLFDAEKEKKIRKIMDKIKAIEQLKLMQAWGTHICNCLITMLIRMKKLRKQDRNACTEVKKSANSAL